VKFDHKIFDKASPKIRAMRQLARNALLSATKEYAGKSTGGVSGGTGGGGSVPNYFGRRFTASNTHNFTPLSDKPCFVVVKRKDGKWVGFPYPGYATWKRQRFGAKPILVASGKMLRELRKNAVAVLEGDRAVAIFRLTGPAAYHYTGTKTMPRRDPVTPNDADRAAFRERARVMLNQLMARWSAANR
jgi:hypothetical protein